MYRIQPTKKYHEWLKVRIFHRQECVTLSVKGFIATESIEMQQQDFMLAVLAQRVKYPQWYFPFPQC